MRLVSPLAFGFASLLVASFAAAPAFAQSPEGWAETEPDAPPPPPPVRPAPPPPPAAPAPPASPGVVLQTSPGTAYGPTPPPNVSLGPDGRVIVSQTPAGPVDVHAPTPDGMVHAYGCSRVEVDPRTRTALPQPPPGAAAAGPPPCAAPYPYAYPYYVPYPAYPMYPYAYYRVAPAKPKYAPDQARTTAIALSTVLFGVATVGGGTWYLEEKLEEHPAFGRGHTNLMQERAALATLGAGVIVPASIPRFTMGDVGMGLLFTGLRAGSFAIGALPNWGKDNWAAPLTFAFAAPVALSIIDLATTPHREQMARKHPPVSAKQKVELTGIAPTVAFDQRGNAMPAIGALGRF